VMRPAAPGQFPTLEVQTTGGGSLASKTQRNLGLMKSMTTLHGITLLSSLLTCGAIAQDYNFSGNLNLLFERSGAPVNVFEQRYGRMCYHNGNTVGELSTEGYILKTGLPTFDQSWSLSAKVTIPLAAEGLATGSASPEQFTEIGVACLFGDQSLSLGLQVYPTGVPVTRAVLAEVMRDGQEFFDRQGDAPTSQETVVLLLRYDSPKRLLQAFADGKPVFDLDIAAGDADYSSRVMDWGMQAQSEFKIAIFANSQDYKVAKDMPLQLDDFSFHIDGTTQPATPTVAISKQAVLLQATGNPAQSYEIQQSDNLVDWITTMTIYGTGGALQVPVSADAASSYFRLK